MERQIADLSDVSGEFADRSPAAGTDHDAPYRRAGETAASFRRPPASAGTPSSGARRRTPGQSLEDTGSWNAFAAGDTGDIPVQSSDRSQQRPGALFAERAAALLAQQSQDDLNREAGGALEGRARREAEDRWEAEQQREHRPEPPFGPAPPATNGRTAFGFTAGPISGHWRDGAPVSGAPVSGTPSSGPPAPAGAHSRGATSREFRAAHRESSAGRSRPEDDHIGDLVGDNAHEIRPHRAAATTPAPPRHSRGVLLAGLSLTAAVIFGGTAAGLAYYSGDGNAGSGSGSGGIVEAGAADRTVERTVSAPIEGRTKASFELVSAVTKVTVRSADLGDALYRMTTADDSGMVPKPVLEREGVKLNLAPEAEAVPGTGEVEVTLSSKVSWSLRFSGGADEQQLDLEKGRIEALDFQGGARRTSIRLPEAAGTVPVKVLGAVDELAMTSPSGNPVRVKVRGGAQTVAAGARTLKDIEPGSTITPKNWATDDRYDVEARSRVTLLTVDTRE